MFAISGATLRTMTSNPWRRVTLRCRASLAPAAHGDEEVSVPDVDDRDLPAVGSDGTVDFPVQEFLNDCPDSRRRSALVRLRWQ